MVGKIKKSRAKSCPHRNHHQASPLRMWAKNIKKVWRWVTAEADGGQKEILLCDLDPHLGKESNMIDCCTRSSARSDLARFQAACQLAKRTAP